MKSRVAFFWGSAALVGAAVVIACGDDDGPAATNNGVDASYDGSVTDGSVAPDVAEKDGEGPVTGTRVFLANDVTTVSSAIRMCVLSSSTSDEPGLDDVLDMPPFPSATTGLAGGLIAPAEIPTSLTGRSARFAMFYVASLEAFNLSSKSCKEIVASVIRPGGSGSAVLVEGADFELGAPVPRTFFRSDRSYVLLATGCPKASNVDTMICPSNADGGAFDNTVSYFRATAHELDPTPASSPDKNRAQFLYGSTTVADGIEMGGDPPNLIGTVRYPDSSLDGGVRREVIVGAEDGGSQVLLESSGVLLPALGTEVSDLRTMESFGFELTVDYPPFIREAAWIDELSPMSISTVQPSKSYTFVLIGTPMQDPVFEDGGRNAASFHIAIVPNE